jgi:hypothetical protein
VQPYGLVLSGVQSLFASFGAVGGGGEEAAHSLIHNLIFFIFVIFGK